MRQTEKIVLASTNTNKLREFREIFLSYPEVEILSAAQFIRNTSRISQVEEHGTYLENATAKARLVNHGCHYPSLADDTGLEVTALEGKPGVRSHRYADLRDLNFKDMNQDEANIKLLLSELEKRPDAPRTARFVCVLALVMEGLTIHANGIMEGSITDSPRGDRGFGYDSIFLPKDSKKTLAEMTEAEKNAISHRALAAHELMNKIHSMHISLVRP